MDTGDAGFDGGLDWDTLYGEDEDELFDSLDPFGGYDERSDRVQEPVPAEDRAVMLHRFGRRVSGVTWSPGGAVSFVAYDKVLEGRLRGKSHMEANWRAHGWDEKAPVTRHEARLRREALRARGVPETKIAEFDDPWQMLEHQQDLFGYVVGRSSNSTAAADCPPEVDMAWLRRVAPEPNETNRSRWPTDPIWAVVQAASFADAPCRSASPHSPRSALGSCRATGSRLLWAARQPHSACPPRSQTLEPLICYEGTVSGL